MLRSDSPAPADIESVLDEALLRAVGTGARTFEPLVHGELAELATLTDDHERRRR